MAFRNLGTFGKAVVVGTCAATVGAFFQFRQIPWIFNVLKAVMKSRELRKVVLSQCQSGVSTIKTFRNLKGAISYSTMYTDFYKTWYNINEPPTWYQEKMTSTYKELQQQENNNSLLKKHLSQKVFNKLKTVKTPRGATLLHCMQGGVDNPDSTIGACAPESDAYDYFSDLFDPIISELHNGAKKQPASDWGQRQLNYFDKNLDADGKYVKRTEIQCVRNIKGFLFPPLASVEDYFILERRFKSVFEKLDKDLKGKFVSLNLLTTEDERNLEKINFSYKNDDKFLQSVNGYQHWPKGRSIFYRIGDDGKNVVALINGEDQLKVITSSKGGDVKSTMDTLYRLVNKIEDNNDGIRLKFARHHRLGYITFCPANLGSGITATAEVKLPSLSSSKDFQETCDKLNLSVRDKGNGVFLVSNKQKFGVTEFEAVKQMYDGVKQLIEMEKGGGDKKK